MNRVRSLLAQALTLLLLVQWGGGPAHCLAMAANAFDGAVICHAGDGAPNPDGGAPVTADQSCPICHALGHAVVAPAPPALPVLRIWSVAAPPVPRPAINPAAPRVPPQQPRAPPASSV